MATKSFDLIDALIESGFERGIDRVMTYPTNGEYYTVVLRKSYSVDERVNDWGVLNDGFKVEVQVTYHNGMNYGVRVFYSNGKVKDHAYNKRTFNAIRDTVRYNGFEL
jgi:hypothetical protein